MSWQPYAVPPAPPKRPPLTRAQRTRALVAGAVGFSVFSWGLALLAFSTIATVLVAIFSFVVGLARQGPVDRGTLRFVQWFEGIDGSIVGWVIVGGFLLASILLIVGFFVSQGILRGGRVNRPTAVTWSSIGIALVAGSIVGSLGGLFGSMFGWVAWVDPGVAIAVTTLSGLLSLAVTAAVGAFTWWWMAHVFRASAAD